MNPWVIRLLAIAAIVLYFLPAILAMKGIGQ